MPQHTREIHLVARPRGWPTPDDFSLVEVALPDPAPGEVLVRNSVMSVDPYMRGRMNDVPSYVAPYALGEALDGGAVGEVLVSRDERLSPGDVVQHGLGWREHAVLPAKAARKLDVSEIPASAYLGALGMPAFTAYVGLSTITGLRAGDRVLISGAAGAVGSVAGQMARLMGAAKVTGTAGSQEKVSWLRDELGFDAALNYRDGDLTDMVCEEGPYDVYFDNVGGAHLEAAIASMADFGRIAACGSIATYNDAEPTPGPRNMFAVVQKRITLQGFIVTDHPEVAREFYRRTAAWIRSGELEFRETFVDGLDSAVDGFLGMCRGENTGKMLVRLVTAAT
jgi:NADPH-dependent curcumin reductase CurA